MDLGKFLRDRKKDVVKRWQNSTVLDAVSANTQADQARRVAQGAPQQYQGNKFAQGLTNFVGANKMQDTSAQDKLDDQTFKSDLSKIVSLRTSGQITPEQARGKALNAAPTGNTDYTKDVLNNQANRSGIGQAVLPALGTFSKPFATGLSDIGTAVGTGVEAFTPFNGVGKNIQEASKRQSQGIDDLYKASSFNGGQKGENRLVTGVSSGLGSLASSLATGATKGLTTGAGRTLLNPTTMSGLQFGLSAGAGQMRDATDNGKSAGRAFGTGLVAGGVEAGLEKVGLDKYLGAGGNFARRTGTRMLTEGLQEGSQSLAQSLVSGTFKHVNPVDAIKQAALEGGMGGLVGGIGGVGGDIALNLQERQDTQAPSEVKQQVVQSKPVLQQTGIPARPGSIRERIQVAKENVTNTIANTITPMNEAGSIPNVLNRQPRMRVEERAALEAYMDHMRGTGTPLLPSEQAIVVRDAMQAAKRLNIPVRDGTGLEAVNIDNFFNNNRQPVAPEGFDNKTGLPMTFNSPEVKTRMMKDYIEGRPPVRGSALSGEGVRVPGANMSKQAQQTLMDRVRARVGLDEKGGATIGDIPGLNKLAKDPLDSLKQEARKYKSVEEYSAAILERAKKEYGETFTDANAYLEGQQRLAQGGNYAAIADRSDPISQSTKLRTVYRGSPSGKSFHLVHGDFLAPTKSEAAAYGGVVKELQIPENQLVSGGKNSYIYKNKAKAAPEPMSLTDLYNQATSLKDNQTGSVQIPKVLTNISERIRNSSLAKNEGGYAKNPFYDKKNDIAKDLTPEQSDFINQYANMLEDMGSGNGVTVNPETNQRVSSNYRNPELGSGKVSKAEWFDQARKEIESGKGAYGASEEYKALTKKEVKKPAVRERPQTTDNDFQNTLPSATRPNSIKEIVKSGGNPLYHDTTANGVLGILESGEIQTSQAPFSSIAGQGKRVSTTRNFDNYSRYGKAPYRLVIDESLTGQKAKPDNREEFESIFKNNVSTKAVKSLAIDITNPAILNDIRNGTVEKVIAQAKSKGINVETFEGKLLPDIYSNKEVQEMTKNAYNKAFPTQKSSSKNKSPKPPVQDLPSISTRIAESKKQLQTDQSLSGRPSIPTTDTSASRPSNMAQDTPIAVKSTTKQGKKQGDALTPENFAKTFGGTVKQAETTLSDTPRFDAATRTDKGKDANKLFESMKTDAKINQATKEAQASGKELNFYAKKDANDRSVGIEQFNPETQRIEAGFVVDKNQNILGNHIKVDANGIQVNVGGKVVNMESILGNPLDWGNTPTSKSKKAGYRLSETMNRNIDNNAPNTEIANKTKNFLWSNKVKAEADMRTELDSEYKALGDRIKKTNKAKPMGVSSQQWKDDIFSVLNGDKTDAQIQETYGQKAQAILDYKKETRTLYDSLLQRVNTERVKFGQAPIQARKDYITHLTELNRNKGFVADVYGQMKNSFADEGMGKTRNGVPGDIAGRTENFKPISKYNPFLQRRTGTKSERDPYMAVQEYLQPALYNIHMTESGARARAIESAFRTAEAIRNTEPRTLLDEAKKITDKYQTNSDNAKLITGFQEYANAIAGKTQRFDRQVVDSSDAAAKGLKGWQRLQKTGGQATILGNASSILAQPLNQVVGLADAGPINYMKGISAAIAGDPAIKKSAFVKARETEPTKAIRKTGEKIMDAGSVPLQKVELASVKLMWHTQHQKALSQGLKGQEAIQQADLNTERLVAGRGIADKPELYRSTVANGVLQYTLEVNASNKTFWQDLSPKQKATFLVASTATNTLMGAVTGFAPLPDFLKAMFETGKDILDGEDDDNIAQDLVQGGQKMLDQYARMNPLFGAPVNLLPQAQRKAIFGQDSDTGRFSGSTAPVQVVTNAVKAASDLTKGNYTGARDNILRDVPFGNQIRKTITGKEMIERGYAVDSSGKKTFDAPTSPLGKAQALVFGPSATKPAREYYDNKSTSKSSSKSVATKDGNGNETTTDDFETISKATFNNAKGKEFMALTNDDARKEFARQSPDNRAIYDDYKALQKAYNGGDKLLAPGLDETSTKTLNKYDRMTPKAKENIFNSKPNAEYEYELAAYSNKKANGETNLVDEINTQQKLSKLKATKDFQKGYRDLYSGLSKAEVYDLITSNPDGKKIAEQLLAIDDALVKVGNKSKFRDKYGNVDFNPARSKSASKGGKKSDGTLAANSLTTDTLQKLNSLLAGTQKPVTGYKKATGGKVALKKIIVKK